MENRFKGIKRDYTEEDVKKLRGTFNVEYSVSKQLSSKLWKLLKNKYFLIISL